MAARKKKSLSQSGTRKRTTESSRSGGTPTTTTARLPVLKTYKLYVNGQFPRTESGRTMKVTDARDRLVAHACRASRKDLRDAVRYARSAQKKWAQRSAYNRGQVLYRMAEMLEGKAEEMAGILACTVAGGLKRARIEVTASIDRLVYFGGWADKYPQVIGCANPVAGPYYNFTVPEPTGVIGVFAPDEQPLLGFVSLSAPALCAGNAVVAVGSENHPIAAAVMGEVCATSDVPPGVVNILTGFREELVPVMAAHRDVDGIHAAGVTADERRTLELGRAENIKRVHVRELPDADWYDSSQCESPYWIEPFVEMKTIWHPSAT